ncbi:hypothetical protein F5Y04DRAFT_277533 [Hypomontagnella monticulosa]|nr:hypothetical protein F5Y04DRAFT_277533 [Hypomontagnella monticulosa]
MAPLAGNHLSTASLMEPRTEPPPLDYTPLGIFSSSTVATMYILLTIYFFACAGMGIKTALARCDKDHYYCFPRWLVIPAASVGFTLAFIVGAVPMFTIFVFWSCIAVLGGDKCGHCCDRCCTRCYGWSDDDDSSMTTTDGASTTWSGSTVWDGLPAYETHRQDRRVDVPEADMILPRTPPPAYLLS